MEAISGKRDHRKKAQPTGATGNREIGPLAPNLPPEATAASSNVTSICYLRTKLRSMVIASSS
jgi:hypothetical protein